MDIITLIQVIISILLIVAILLQNKGSSLGGAFGGGGGGFDSFHTKRGFENFLHYGTIFLSFLFIATAIAHVYFS